MTSDVCKNMGRAVAFNARNNCELVYLNAGSCITSYLDLTHFVSGMYTSN